MNSSRRSGSRRGLLRVLALLLLLAGPTWRSVAGQTPPVPEATRSALLALEKEWDDAIVRKDMAVLERILDPGFLFIDVDGTVTRRSALLAGIRSPKLVIEPFVTRDVEVRVYGSTAVLTGWFEQKGSYDGRRFTLRQRYTDVYVRVGSRWVVVSAHASTLSRLTPPPAGQ
jgi:ketosteroid isomerase-like protein